MKPVGVANTRVSSSQLIIMPKYLPDHWFQHLIFGVQKWVLVGPHGSQAMYFMKTKKKNSGLRRRPE